jgi:hypothetical protein
LQYLSSIFIYLARLSESISRRIGNHVSLKEISYSLRLHAYSTLIYYYDYLSLSNGAGEERLLQSKFTHDSKENAFYLSHKLFFLECFYSIVSSLLQENLV